MKLKPFIERIIKEIGPRPAGSESEYKAGEIIADELKKRGAVIEHHDTVVCPTIIAGLIKLMTGAYLFGVVFYLFFPLLTVAVVAVLLLLLLGMRIFGNGVIDWLFKKVPTRNIIGKYASKKEARHHIIFSGHHDSPNMMPLFYSRFKKHIHLIETATLVGMALLVPAGIGKCVATGLAPTLSGFFGWYDILFLISLLGLVPGLYYRFMMISKVRNLGANDNLSAVAVLLGLAEYIKKHPPKQTEVWLVSFGSEEPLIYGSAGFARDFPDIIRRAVHFNMETVGAGSLAVIAKENMTMTRYTPEIVEFIQRAGKRAGVTLPAIDITYGGTDSYPIIKKGGRSACLFGMDETELFSLWHAPSDNPKNIREENLQKALAVCIEALRECEEKKTIP
jgi:hypothetical protein